MKVGQDQESIEFDPVQAGLNALVEDESLLWRLELMLNPSNTPRRI